MNPAAVGTLGKFANYGGLLKFASLKPADLTADVVRQCGAVLGFQVPEDKIEGVMALIRAEDTHSLAEWASRQENITKLRDFVAAPKEEGPVVVKCPHCSDVFELYYEG